MKCNGAGLALIQKYEGCRLQAYKDPRGIWTIGYGHTGDDVGSGLIWTQEQADQELAADINMRAERPVTALVEVLLTSNQFSALCSLVYNIGSGNFKNSSVLASLNRGAYAAIPVLIGAWDHIGGLISSGLYERRQAEIDLWNMPDTPDSLAS